jgi:carbon-monoxide dehydrogenase medium subunit
VIPAAFDYEAPGSVAEVVSLLGDGVHVLGGGTWLVPEMHAGEVRPRRVVDLGRAGIDAITVADRLLRIGAMATYADLLASADVRDRAPLLARMAAGITGGAAIRAQGTVGGSLVAARPQSDAPAVLVALGGRAVVAGPAGERRIPVSELIAGPMRTTLAADEVLVAVELAAHGAGCGYVKLKRGESSWPIATAAALIEAGPDGRCRTARLALGGVAGTPVEVELSALLGGAARSPGVLADAAAMAAAAIEDPWEDVLAPAAYRAAVAGPVARRAIDMAWEDATTWS